MKRYFFELILEGSALLTGHFSLLAAGYTKNQGQSRL